MSIGGTIAMQKIDIELGIKKCDTGSISSGEKIYLLPIHINLGL